MTRFSRDQSHTPTIIDMSTTIFSKNPAGIIVGNNKILMLQQMNNHAKFSQEK